MDLDNIDKQKELAVSRAAANLKEHFDCYIILTCHTMEDGSVGNVFSHSGNYFTLIGMADMYIDNMKEAYDGCSGEDQTDN